jgi:hypothetical protein
MKVGQPSFGIRTQPSRIPACRAIALLVFASGLTGSSALAQTRHAPVPDSLSGGLELRVSVQQAWFNALRPLGLGVDVGRRSAGVRHRASGRFSFGAQITFFPSLGSTDELPYDIWHLSKLNLGTSNGEPASIRFESVKAREGDFFLVPKEGAEITGIDGYLTLSPGGTDVIELQRHELRGMRMSMLGAAIPLRWRFLNDARRVRPFLDAGIGFELVMTRAEYTVTTEAIVFDQQEFEIYNTVGTQSGTEPMRGEVSSSMLFTRWHTGAGCSFGHFDLFLRAHWYAARTLEESGDEYRRLRGNPLAVPFLADAANNQELAQEVESEGIAIYARAGLSKKESDANGTKTSDPVTGLSRFWSPSGLAVGLSFRLR